MMGKEPTCTTGLWVSYQTCGEIRLLSFSNQTSRNQGFLGDPPVEGFTAWTGTCLGDGQEVNTLLKQYTL
jgi:hypothetical protein